ncbi:hypothetical protein [Kitasatospora sp. NPDC002965]
MPRRRPLPETPAAGTTCSATGAARPVAGATRPTALDLPPCAGAVVR